MDAEEFTKHFLQDIGFEFLPFGYGWHGVFVKNNTLLRVPLNSKGATHIIFKYFIYLGGTYYINGFELDLNIPDSLESLINFINNVWKVSDIDITSIVGSLFEEAGYRYVEHGIVINIDDAWVKNKFGVRIGCSPGYGTYKPYVWFSVFDVSTSHALFQKYAKISIYDCKLVEKVETIIYELGRGNYLFNFPSVATIWFRL